MVVDRFSFELNILYSPMPDDFLFLGTEQRFFMSSRYVYILNVKIVFRITLASKKSDIQISLFVTEAYKTNALSFRLCSAFGQ